MAKKKKFVSKKKADSKSEIDETGLLEVAMGIKPPSEVMTEKFWNKAPSEVPNFERYRREARRAIYKIIKYMKLKKDYKSDPKLNEMFELINPMLVGDMGLRWDNFSNVWDVHPKDITKIVLKEHWFREGGGIDTELGTKAPTAFTSQKI